ncbi:hypothetical protein HU200_008359 [Digitaria exilis]|uniref:F-box domain-containing protein n=1 Tax=Digitaria exilis TaxID=1010633 RepID=A0A835FN44_9POAL|nr:hypothetical protein HU200_008359 [Digitaria exilis]
MVMVSPLHSAITADRWDAEGLLGRLIVLVHAAFLDAGFVPLPRHPWWSRSTVPRQAGETASALSLRYAAPQLPLLLLQQQQQHRHGAAEVAVLRLLAHGSRHLVLYARSKCGPWPVERCAVVDALAAAPLLSGGLDATARREAGGALAPDLRRALPGRARRHVPQGRRRAGAHLHVAPRRRQGGAVLSRLATGGDLARVERVCNGLRRLVAERDCQLWKPRYRAGSLRLRGCCHSPETSWKERYMKERRGRLPRIITSPKPVL